MKEQEKCQFIVHMLLPRLNDPDELSFEKLSLYDDRKSLDDFTQQNKKNEREKKSNKTTAPNQKIKAKQTNNKERKNHPTSWKKKDVQNNNIIINWHFLRFIE